MSNSGHSLQNKDFRNKKHVLSLCDKITQLSNKLAEQIGRPLQVMEICGGHTHAIYRFGIDQLLPTSIEFVHGPGCPVCVLPPDAIDHAIQLAMPANRILLSFGDALKVSGSYSNLLQAKASGADVRVLYAPFDALDIAKQNPDKQIVFFALGFDTTMPGIAYTIEQTRKYGIENLFFLIYHIQLIPTLKALFSQDDYPMLDGLIGPGHVSMVIGSDAYQEIVKSFQIPLVISGFEPVEILQALYHVLLQIEAKQAKVENAYPRVVSDKGNTAAKIILEKVFEPDLNAHWRGLGVIANSGVKLTQPYQQYDAVQFLSEATNKNQTPPLEEVIEPEYCQQVLTGRMRPTQCPHFRNSCNPETPKGALMVSSEGACAAYFQYKSQNREQ